MKLNLEMPMERTLAIIKPDACDRSEEIEEIIKNEDFTILQSKILTMTEEQARMFYEEHIGKAFLQDLVDYMTSGPVKVLVLTRENAIEKWRKVIGPTNVIEAIAQQPESIRAKFGTSEFKNAVHGSSDFSSAEREILLFFPELTFQPTVTGQAAKVYLSETVNPVLLKGLTELCKQKPSDPIVWLADWLLVNNPNKQPNGTSNDNTESSDE